MAEPRSFLLNTDYASDKVTWKYNGSSAVPKYTTTSDFVNINIPHGLGYAPFVKLVYSDDNFATRYQAGTTPQYFDGRRHVNRYAVQTGSDSTNIYVAMAAFGSSANLSYKLVCIAPEDSDLMTTARIGNAQAADPSRFHLDTDNNYLKILSESKSAYTFIADFGKHTFTARTGLTYTPFVGVYFQNQSNGRIQEASASMNVLTPVNGQIFLTGQSLEAVTYIEANTIKSVVENYAGNQTIRMIYRIYADE